MKFGITESGDASLDYTWEEKLDQMDGTILITKNLTLHFMERLLAVKDKPVILHASCTGYGGTSLEPNIPSAQDTIHRIRCLIDQGWPAERIVLRIDPIIPTPKGLRRVQSIVEAAQEVIPEVTRIRISVLDMYPHVARRFAKAGIPHPYNGSFQAHPNQFSAVNWTILSLKTQYPFLAIESCAEVHLPTAEAIGCVSHKDFALLGIDEPIAENKEKQRKSCLCAAGKTELLPYRWRTTGYNHCYGCLYCYWQTEADQ